MFLMFGVRQFLQTKYILYITSSLPHGRTICYVIDEMEIDSCALFRDYAGRDRQLWSAQHSYCNQDSPSY